MLGIKQKPIAQRLIKRLNLFRTPGVKMAPYHTSTLKLAEIEAIL